MPDNKFKITNSSGGARPNNFIPNIPNFQTKPKVIIIPAVVAALKKAFINTGQEVEDEPLSRSGVLSFNTPVFSNIEFQEGSYIDENGSNITFKGLKIELALITVMNQRNIIETTLQGRNGTVKEYISDGDYQVKIEGKIYGPGANAYPYEDVQTLIQLCTVPLALTVNSDFLKMFNNTSSIVIRSFNIDQQEAIRNYQEFTLNCISDKELILLKNA